MEEPQDEHTDGSSRSVTYDELEMAAFHNNQAFVQDWLNSNDQQICPWQGRLLSRAAYHHSVDVVKCIITCKSFGLDCKDIVNHVDSKGKTPLHYAAEGSGQTNVMSYKVKNKSQNIKPVNMTVDLLDIIGCLFNNGADPTVKCKVGRTPRNVATQNGFKLGETLLEILERVWSKGSVRDIDNRKEKICLHKELLQWAVDKQHEKVITSILHMHISTLPDPNRSCTATDGGPSSTLSEEDILNAKFLLGTTEGLYANTCIHVAANIGNMKLLETLLICSGLPLNTVINLRWKNFAEHIEPSLLPAESGHTPLSLALSHSSYCDFINIFLKLQSDGDCVTHIDLSHTMINFLPRELFNLNCITNLNVSNNKLTNLSLLFDNFLSLRFGQLIDLDLSKNDLKSLPMEIFRLPALTKLNVSNNPLSHLPERWWYPNSLEKLNASRTHIIELCANGNTQESPKSSQSSHTVHNSIDSNSTRLKELDISYSCVDSFPKYLACYFPALTNLNVSHNNMTSCCAINELPPLLEELDISHNNLQSENSSIFHISTKEEAFHCHLSSKLDSPQRCFHMRHKSLKSLRTLNLSDNETLKNIILHYDDSNAPCLFFPKIKKLTLNNCGLLHTPSRLGRMSRIYHLDIGNNKMNVPREVCNLAELSTFIYDGLPDPVVADLSKFTSVKDQQIFLIQENAKRAPSLKLMFVGLSGRGKSTLLSYLKYTGKTKSLPVTLRQRLESMNINKCDSLVNAYPEEIQSTVGIDQDLWCYAKNMDAESGVPNKLPITFYAWDFAGQEEYSAAHQCFITENSLYVLCWRASDGEQGIHELKDWLLTIKARAKSAVVVIVGTHIDQVKHFRLEKKKIYTDKINELYSDRFCYPTIKEIKFVCCDIKSKKYQKHKENITDLRDTLYDVASEMKLSLGDGRRFEQKLIDVMIPESFLNLQDRIHFEARYFRLHKEKGPPILSWKEILKFGKDCGFKEDNETAVAIKYTKEQGRLMHFDSSGLKDYYFIDSQWLCDMFAHVVSSEFNTSFTAGGKADRRALELSLAEKFKVPGRFMEAIITLLSKFELAIPLDRNTFLIPSLLQSGELNDFSGESYKFPRTNIVTLKSQQVNTSTSSLTSSLNSSNLHTNTKFPVVARRLCTKEVVLHSTGMCYRRIFVANYIPVNFWPRLISRFLSSAKSFHKIICNNCFPNVYRENLIEVGNAIIGALSCRWSYSKNHIMLELGHSVILCVNGFYGFNDVDNRRERFPISHSVPKLEKMYVYHGDNKGFKSVNVNDGFEIIIPDYVVHSGTNPENLVHESRLLGAQILSHVLETIDEMIKAWFEGLMEEGIYSEKYLTQLIPCPYCFGDDKPMEALNATLERELSVDPYSEMISKKAPNGPIGFSFQYCLQQARLSNYVKCPSCTVGKKLSLKYLAPDIMFEDKKFTKICPKTLRSDNTLGKGGYGYVYRAQYLKRDPPQDVAVKCFTKGDVIAIENLCQLYADVRSEFNKLMTVNHRHVVDCIGFCVPSLSFVLELAPLGCLKNIMQRHSKSGFYMCPNSLVAIVTQVSRALDYLHTKEFIVHYDIKPGNILVFRFPTVGHDCYDENSHNFSCTRCEDDRVEVKLADLGISAFVGPRGFHRKQGTPGHTAPEAIKYAGKEPLGEKVDIFSLGITLYELMTLQLLPPHDVSSFEFDSEIKDGIRPAFLDEVPNYPMYPAIIKELVINCWAQEYAARPSAREIFSILQSPNCLKLSNVLKTELPYSAVSAAVVVTVDDQQSLWLAHSIDDQHKVSVYEFNGLNNTSLVDLHEMKRTIDMKSPVLAMCQVDSHVLLALKPTGTLVAVRISSFQKECHIMGSELAKDDLLQMLALNDQVALAYKDGTVALVSCLDFEENDIKEQAIEDEMSADATTHKDLKLSVVKVASSQLYAIEACKPGNSDQVELWCGCDSSFIEIFTIDESLQLKSKSLLKTHTSSPNIPQDVSIIQLKLSFNTAAHMMYALHSCGSVISCWSVCEQPALNAVIKLTNLSSPAKEMFSLIEDGLIIADKSGKVYQLTKNPASDGDDFLCQQLPSSHQPGETMYLFRLHGMMNVKGSLSSIGSPVIGISPSSKLRYYANISAVKSFPCAVLLGLRAGYMPLRATNNQSTLSLYFTTWTFPTTNAPHV